MKTLMAISTATLLLCAIAVPSIWVPSASAQDCLNYGDYLHWVGGVDTPGDTKGVAVAGNYVYVADGSSGLHIAWQQCDELSGIDEDILDPEPTDTPQAMVNLSVHPNPFNPRTTITFSIDHPQTVELCIFDMMGKRIAVLADRTFHSGVHTMNWQGKDVQGRAVASGTYLVRMATDERVTSEKMMLIR